MSGGESSIFVYSTSSISLYPPVTDPFPKVSMVTLTRPAQTPAVPRRGVLSTPGTRPQTRPGSRYSVSVASYSSASQTRARPGGKWILPVFLDYFIPVYLYNCTHLCISKYSLRLYTCAHVRMCTWKTICTYTCTTVDLFTCIHIHMHTSTFVHMSVCIYIHM